MVSWSRASNSQNPRGSNLQTVTAPKDAHVCLPDSLFKITPHVSFYIQIYVLMLTCKELIGHMYSSPELSHPWFPYSPLTNQRYIACGFFYVLGYLYGYRTISELPHVFTSTRDYLLFKLRSLGKTYWSNYSTLWLVWLGGLYSVTFRQFIFYLLNPIYIPHLNGKVWLFYVGPFWYPKAVVTLALLFSYPLDIACHFLTRRIPHSNMGMVRKGSMLLAAYFITAIIAIIVTQILRWKLPGDSYLGWGPWIFPYLIGSCIAYARFTILSFMSIKRQKQYQRYTEFLTSTAQTVNNKKAVLTGIYIVGWYLQNALEFYLSKRFMRSSIVTGHFATTYFIFLSELIEVIMGLGLGICFGCEYICKIGIIKIMLEYRKTVVELHFIVTKLLRMKSIITSEMLISVVQNVVRYFVFGIGIIAVEYVITSPFKFVLDPMRNLFRYDWNMRVDGKISYLLVKKAALYFALPVIFVLVFFCIAVSGEDNPIFEIV